MNKIKIKIIFDDDSTTTFDSSLPLDIIIDNLNLYYKQRTLFVKLDGNYFSLLKIKTLREV